MKKKWVAIVLMLASAGGTLQAQNTRADSLQVERLNRLVDLQQQEISKRDGELKQLKDSLDARNKQLSEIDRLRKQSEKDAKTITELNEKLRAEKESGKASAHQAEKKQLQESIQNLQKDLEDRQAEIEEVQARAAAHEKTILELEKELKSLNDFKVKWLADLTDGIDGKWLGKPYSLLNEAELEQEFRQFDQFAQWDPKVAEGRDKLKGLLEEKHLFEQGMQLISSRYDPSRVSRCASELTALEGNVQHPEKKEELKRLITRLEDYSLNLEIFKNLIRRIDKVTKDFPSHIVAWPLVEGILDEQRKEDAIAAIEEIPWLEEQYVRYYEVLSKDCAGPNTARDEILSL